MLGSVVALPRTKEGGVSRPTITKVHRPNQLALGALQRREGGQATSTKTRDCLCSRARKPRPREDLAVDVRLRREGGPHPRT